MPFSAPVMHRSSVEADVAPWEVRMTSVLTRATKEMSRSIVHPWNTPLSQEFLILFPALKFKE